MKKEKRKEAVRRRKNFLPTLAVTIFLWIILVLTIIFVDPASIFAKILFLTVIFLSVLFSLSIIFANSKRGLLYSFSFLLFVILRLFGVGNILNAILLLASVISLDIYLGKK